KLQSNDRIVLLARKYVDTDPIENFFPKSSKRNQANILTDKNSKRKLLILGWNHKMPALIQEFDSYETEHFDIDLLSLIPITQREQHMSRYNSHKKGVTLRHLEGDYTSPSDLQRINPEQYDNIVFLANSWLASNEESDARTILGYLILKRILPKNFSKPEILVELMDPENEKLFQQRTGEVLISPYILSHILAHVALRRELNVVFDELFTVGGAEIYFRPVSFFNFTKTEMNFKEIGECVSEKGEIALGIRDLSKAMENTGGIYLNPPRNIQFKLNDSIELVVLTTYLDCKKGNE
ncbi:MAG: ion channel DMI1, partial [Thermodesulfobacteriota bacterium]|nr:ion channel DMI1 [Thermodesulfobacteriota bacterium]